VALNTGLSLNSTAGKKEGGEGCVHSSSFPSALTLCSKNRLFFHSVNYLTGLFLMSVALVLLVFLLHGFLGGRFMCSECNHFKHLRVVERFSRLKRRA
jgi:succinate dehydrogenase/fumarate reductase cytochrome b subunit